MTQTLSTNPHFDKLKRVLSELFQFDQAELDFGIYRIMNAKRGEITSFLDDDLLPQVQAELGKLAGGNRAELEKELADTLKNAASLGVPDPEALPKVKELHAKLNVTADLGALEADIYNNLAGFFKRYYQNGDFLSLRRYKKDVYAIPYEGEEVKLHWANADQYYVKSSEAFRDYTFHLSDNRRVHFRLTDADTDANNNKAETGKERRFIVADPPLIEENGELTVRFTYRASGEKQAKLNADAADTIMAQPGFDGWLSALRDPRPTEKNKTRTLLDKQLSDYTAKNSFDYFIHKDLRGFLRRELDFFIKNEVLQLDDLEAEGEARVLAQLARVRAMRGVAHKIIELLAQLENFQKKLWLKKKFVVSTDYCVTLDKLIENAPELLDEVAANEAQRREWVRLFAIDELKGDALGVTPGYSEPLTREFLEANPFLVLDTQFFEAAFKDRLLSSFDDLDKQTDGLLIKSENFGALNLLGARYLASMGCAFADPPYNTGAGDFDYKDNYQHASWMSLMVDRLTLCRDLLRANGALFVTIDDSEVQNLRFAMESVFGPDNFVANVIWHKKYARQNDATWFSTAHDHILVSAKEKRVWRPKPLKRNEEQKASYKNLDDDPRGPWQSVVYTCSKNADERPNLYYPIVHPKSGKEIWPERSRVWAYDRSTHEKNVRECRVWWGTGDEKSKPRKKVFLGELSDGFVPDTLWKREEVGDNQESQRELAAFGINSDFATPKPHRLIRRVAEIASDSKDIVLDFFAGSGTTAHAVINLNREDGGSRKYILVEMGDYFDSVLKPRIGSAVR